MTADTLQSRLTRRIAGPVVASLLGLGVVAAGPLAAAAETWDMPTPYPDTNLHTVVVKQFADDVKAATNGKISITVHTNGSLIRHPEIKRAVQSGQAQLGEVLISSWANEDPLYGLDSVPFLATDFKAAHKLYDVSKPFLEKKLERQRLKLLYSIPWPPQGLYVKDEIQSVEGLKGQKFRAYNPATTRIAELSGAIPVKIEAAEVAQAFGTGIVTAMITSAATGVDTKAWDFVKVYYDVQAWLPRNMVFVNSEVWKGLDANTQKAIQDAAAKAEAKGWAEWEKKTAELNKTMSDNGMKVLPPSDKLKEGLSAIGKTMTEEWIKSAGADGEAIIAAYRK
ncbi:TRAP transporter substrate-binding protein [Azospirillum sp. A1-3]|uniref:TRAP transporter substrate-binding protein n=1 Tax=unclassified Azospirillum TaxID=2630922 RepID=UPI000D6076F5|nr:MULTISPECIES: TRAP transporter substrate-binding protein [unclassified Azospirillum]MCM8736113.1 TRAP transporter substrate-binding protein [Azospirillum sp. A1-3]PWC91833.1 C4-dicarboxylate ABC transporter substrate-binding protein [Azospirillum sp. TSO5]QCG95897.1 C4-dicarboxylate ABC transporter substrate-binding protein [Azospirillum sp. TSA2s]